MTKDYQFNAADYAKCEATWPQMEQDCREGCQCGKPGCDRVFSADNPMEFGCQCHPGSPVWASYWDGYVYIRCAVCDKPVARFAINRSLL